MSKSAQMNKQVTGAVSSSRLELEKDLMADVIKHQERYETGTDAHGQNSNSRRWQQHSQQFETIQGVRRRHPTQVLSNYATVTETNDSPRTTWEKAIQEENNLSMLPKVYQFQGQLSAVQLGIVQTAAKNYERSKNEKLSSMYLTGV